jgi:hypothetical protein
LGRETWPADQSAGGTVKPGVWAQLSASFNHTTGLMDLHINGKDAARAVHLSAWPATGGLRVGAYRSGSSTINGFLAGQVAEILTYNQVVINNAGNPWQWDFTGDNRPDLLAVNSAGQLYLFRGNAAGGFAYGYGTAIGTSWNIYDRLFTVNDFDGDGLPDVIGRKPDGTLWLYRGNGAGTWLNNHGLHIGDGWNTYNTVFSPGDFDSDGHADLLGRKPDGTFWLYRGNGTGGFLNGTGIAAGAGFNTYNGLITPETSVATPTPTSSPARPTAPSASTAATAAAAGPTNMPSPSAAASTPTT